MLRCHADQRAVHVEHDAPRYGRRARADAGRRLPVRARTRPAHSYEPRGAQTRQDDGRDGRALRLHVKSNKLGEVWTEVGFRLASNPDTVRAPDIAFVRRDRLPAKDARGFYRGAPDLAIEVLSPDETQSEVREKMADYFGAGTPVVVIVDPDSKRATVHRAGAAPILLGSDEILDLDEAVAGFRLQLSEVFE